MDIKTSQQIASEQKETEHVPHTKKQKVWIATYIILALICVAAYFILHLQIVNLFESYRDIFLKLSIAGFCSFLTLIITKFAEIFVIRHSHTKAIKYNIVRLIRLLSVVIILFIIVSFLNENWYTAAVSLGLISLILGFSLQSPIASLIGWFYIVIRVPYKVGDRIQISDVKGDVVEINYFDSTLWEFGGGYMTNDLPSGRLIRFPNSLVWQSAVYNYSWKKFPYIWNEIPFYIAYESDFEYVEQVIRSVAKEELGDEIEKKVTEMKNILHETPVDELEIKEYPFVSFRINPNSWVEALLIYLVEPKHASAVRSRLIKKVIATLLEQSDKAILPKGNSR